MNIIFICNELPPGNTGGVGIFVSELTKGLVSKNHKIFIIGFIDNVIVKEICIIDGITVIKLPRDNGLLGLVKSRVLLYKEVRTICNEFPIDIIETPDFEGFAAFLPKKNYKSIVRLHGSHAYFASEMNEKPSFLIKFLEGFSLRKADSIISVSDYTANRTNEIFRVNKEIKVIYNGINIPDLSRCKKDWSKGKKVVFTGSMMKKKGVFSIAEAWPIVKKEIPNAQLFMIGKDTVINGESAIERIREITKNKDVFFYGHLSKMEMEHIMIDCDVAIYPSYSETFGLAPIEAMALMLPTIYTKVSCGPEVVKSEKLVSVCVNPDNSKEIANRLIDFLKNHSLRVDVAKLGRAVVENEYSNSNKVIENEDFYKRIIRNA